MECDRPDSITAYDTLFTTGHIQMLKLLLGYLEPSMQRRLAVYIKFLELQYTLEFFRAHPFASLPLCSETEHSAGSMGKLLDEMIPFCSAKEKEKLQNIKNILQNFENMQEMLQILEMMQEISPEFFQSDPVGTESGQIPGGMDMSQMVETMKMMQEMFDNA